MNSTDRDALLAAFYEKYLVPAAAALKRRGVQMLDPGPDPEATSYWHHRESPGNALMTIDFDQLDREMAALWKDIPELASLSAALVDLARRVREEREESKVDPFIYQMF